MGKLNKTRPGFTLVELILVVMLIVFLFTGGLNGMIRSQESFKFNNAVSQILTMIRKARSFAITGKALPDFTDYDKDGCKLTTADATSMTFNVSLYAHSGTCADTSVTDYVTPVQYGFFVSRCYSNNSVNCFISIFANLHDSSTYGYTHPYTFNNPTYNNPFYIPAANYDIFIEDLKLPDNIYLTTLNDTTLSIYNLNNWGVLYTPIFADVSLVNHYSLFNNNPYPYPSVKFRIQHGPSSNYTRARCFQIHKVSGNPEEISCAP